MKKTLCVIVHEHKNGADANLFYYVGDKRVHSEEEIAEILTIDYEVEKGESLTIAEVVNGRIGESNLPIIKWND